PHSSPKLRPLPPDAPLISDAVKALTRSGSPRTGGRSPPSTSPPPHSNAEQPPTRHLPTPSLGSNATSRRTLHLPAPTISSRCTTSLSSPRTQTASSPSC